MELIDIVDENNKLVTVESFVGSVLEKDNLEEVLKEQISSNEIATGLNVKENYSLIIYGDVNKDGNIEESETDMYVSTLTADEVSFAGSVVNKENLEAKNEYIHNDKYVPYRF